MFSGYFDIFKDGFRDRKTIARNYFVSFCLFTAFTISLMLADPLVSSAGTVERAGPVDPFPASVDEAYVVHDEDVERGAGLPEIFKVSADLLSIGDESKKEKFMEEIEKLLSENRESDAAEALGAALGEERKRSAAYLAFYCRNILVLAGTGMEDRVKFLSSFLRGYGKKGVLILAGEGTERFKASGGKRGSYWKTVKEGEVPSEKYDRIYPSSDAVYIPFELGEIFILDVVSFSERETHIWKVLPGSVNQKTWPGGKWEREITVRGDRAS
jgi:hypothetical protein